MIRRIRVNQWAIVMHNGPRMDADSADLRRYSIRCGRGRIIHLVAVGACWVVLPTTNPRSLALLERILLGEILAALCAVAVDGMTHFHRKGAKDAKKTPRRLGLLRLCCAVLIRKNRVNPRSIVSVR